MRTPFLLLRSTPQSLLHRPRLHVFSATAAAHKSTAPLPPRTPLDPKTYTIAYLKGSGPGGQKINKTSSAVQIKHLPSGIVIKCQDTRSRDQNENLAMRRLQDKIEFEEKREAREELEAEAGEVDSDTNVELSRLERRWELLRKRKASRAKKAKRKYKKLGEKEEGAADLDGAEEGGVEVLGGTGAGQAPDGISRLGGGNVEIRPASALAKETGHDNGRLSRSTQRG